MTTHISESAKNLPLRWSEKIGYGAGDFASCLYFGIFMNFLAIFYTDVFGISATAAGTMVLVVRSWDWINDPIMGAITDRTQTRMGKFRPWLLWMIPPYVVIGILTFSSFDLSETGKLIYAYITYTALTMVYTAINIPYSALMGVMTANSKERTLLASIRFIGAFAGVSFVSGTLPLLVKMFGGGNLQLGYTCTVTLYAALAAMFFFITFKTSKERIQPPKSLKTSFRNDLRVLSQNGPWIMIILISVLTIIWTSLRLGTTMHYFKYVSGNELWGGTILLIYNLTAALAVVATRTIQTAFGSKKRAYLFLNLLSAVVLGSFYFIPSNNLDLLIANQVLFAVVSAPLMPMFWSMIADTADYGAVMLGQRSTGLLFSAGTFSQKIGWSIGPAISLWIIGFLGFVPNEAQNEGTLEGLRVIMSFLPGSVALLTMVLVNFYKIDKVMEEKLESALAPSNEAPS